MIKEGNYCMWFAFDFTFRFMGITRYPFNVIFKRSFRHFSFSVLKKLFKFIFYLLFILIFPFINLFIFFPFRIFIYLKFCLCREYFFNKCIILISIFYFPFQITIINIFSGLYYMWCIKNGWIMLVRPYFLQIYM